MSTPCVLTKLRTDTAGARPSVQLALVGEYRPELFVELAMDRQPFFLFPAMQRSDTAVQVGRNLLPGFKPFPSRRRVYIRCGVRRRDGHRAQTSARGNCSLLSDRGKTPVLQAMR